MNISNNENFKKLSYEEECKLNSAGFSFSTILSSIGKFLGGGALGNILGIGSSITNSINQSMLIKKINSLSKGEIEFGKNGEIKIKWDNSTPSANGAHSTIIF